MYDLYHYLLSPLKSRMKSSRCTTSNRCLAQIMLFLKSLYETLFLRTDTRTSKNIYPINQKITKVCHLNMI